MLHYGVSALADPGIRTVLRDRCRGTANAGNTIKGTNILSITEWPIQELIHLCVVVARFRPPNKAELASGGDQIVDFETEDTCSINVRKGPVLHTQREATSSEGY